MKLEVVITYIYHSCFTLEYQDKILLFDYPDPSFSPEGTEKIVQNLVDGKDLYVFISHGHMDHFSPSVKDLSEYAREVYYIISHDVSLSVFGDEDEVITAHPNSDYQMDEMEIRTFESNDQGVAYLLKINNNYIYYGGDLARWDWPEWSEEKRKEHVNVFEDVIDVLKEMNIDIAFSNMDERLSSWAGPTDFVDKVEPDYFVPIHTFGNPEWIDDFLEKLSPTKTTVMNYEKIGDRIKIDI